MKTYKPRFIKPEASEHDIQTAIIQWLSCMGWFCWRNNAGRLPVGEGSSRRMVILGKPGLPDVFAVKKDYPLLGIEVKKPGNRPTMIQELRLQELREHGVATLVAYSVDDVERFVKVL